MQILLVQPLGGTDEALGQEFDIESQMPGKLLFPLLLFGEQIEQQGSKPGFVKNARYILIARAMPAAAAAMSKQNYGRRVVGQDQLAPKAFPANRDSNLTSLNLAFHQ